MPICMLDASDVRKILNEMREFRLTHNVKSLGPQLSFCQVHDPLIMQMHMHLFYLALSHLVSPLYHEKMLNTMITEKITFKRYSMHF